MRGITEKGERRGEERRGEDENLEEDKKKWEWIREKENWYDYVDFSLHFHFVGYIGWMRKPVEGEEFIYKHIKGKRGYRGMQNDKIEVFKVIHYLLSHAGFSSGFRNSTHVWIGELSYRKRIKGVIGGKRARHKRKKAKCKLCGGPLILFHENMKAFFKGWLNTDFRKLTYREAKLMVLYERRIPHYIAANVLEGLDVLQSEKPPPGYEKFLIDDTYSFLK